LFPNRSHVPEKVSLSELMTGVDLKPTLCMVSCFFPSCCQRTPGAGSEPVPTVRKN
jgi:hypothetical protein